MLIEGFVLTRTINKMVFFYDIYILLNIQALVAMKHITFWEFPQEQLISEKKLQLHQTSLSNPISHNNISICKHVYDIYVLYIIMKLLIVSACSEKKNTTQSLMHPIYN